MYYRFFNDNLREWNSSETDISIPIIYENNDTGTMTFGDDILRGHVLVVGGPRTGKTNFLLQLAKECRRAYPDALFVFKDVKGDFLPLYHAGDKLCSFYPVLGEYEYFRPNLIKECMLTAHPEDEAREIAAKLFKDRVNNSGGNRFFPRAAQQIYEAYITTVLRRCDGILYPTHKEISRQLRRMSIDDMRTRLAMEDDLQGALSNIARSGSSAVSNQAAGVMAEFNQFISSFYIGMMADDGMDTVSDFLNAPGGTALFLEYDIKREESANLLFRLILSLLIQNKLSSASDNRKVFLFLDEFPILKGDYGILNALHVGAGNGLRIIGALQSKEQVFGICEGRDIEHVGNSILGGFSTLVGFHPNDEQTVSFIQHRIGEDNVSYYSLGLSRYDSPHQTIQYEPLVSSREINGLRLGEAFIKMREYDYKKVKFRRFES